MNTNETNNCIIMLKWWVVRIRFESFVIAADNNNTKNNFGLLVAVKVPSHTCNAIAILFPCYARNNNLKFWRRNSLKNVVK